jgi:hypothetical protein
MSTFNMHIDMGPEEAVDAINWYFEKVATWFVGDMEPEIKLPLLVWADTHEGVYKQRNLENTAWINRGPISGAWGLPVGAMITMTGLPPNMSGFVQATGATLLREDYPLLWEFAQHSNNIVTDEEWSNQKRYYSYSFGDGETTFRIPRAYDFERGWDPSSGLSIGQWRPDQMQKITAALGIREVEGQQNTVMFPGGAFTVETNEAPTYTLTGGSLSSTRQRIRFDSSNSPNARTSETTSGETWPCHGVLPKLIYTGEVW